MEGKHVEQHPQSDSEILAQSRLSEGLSDDVEGRLQHAHEVWARPLTMTIEGFQEPINFLPLHLKRSDSDVIHEPEEHGHCFEVTSKVQGVPLGFRTNRKPPGHVMVTFVGEGTFAEKKGILPGYVITKLNGLDLGDMDGEEFLMHMRTRPCAISFWVPRSADDPEKPKLIDRQGPSPQPPRADGDGSARLPEGRPTYQKPKLEGNHVLEAPGPTLLHAGDHGTVAQRAPDPELEIQAPPDDDQEGITKISIPIPETSTPSGSDAGDQEEKITYVSDVEGHWDYFCRFVELSAALRFVTDTGIGSADAVARMREPPDLELAAGWHFVYGGDSCDKGPGTIRFVKTLVNLKKKYPARVHLIMGNRDINKMRLTSELASSQTDLEGFKRTAAAYWVPSDRRITPVDFLRKHVALSTGSNKEDVTDEVLAGYCNKAAKFKYMLVNDMVMPLHAAAKWLQVLLFHISKYHFV